MNTKRKKTGRRVLSFLLTLAMLVGLVPGMGLTAYAAGGGTEVTQANVICQQYSYMDAGYYSGGTFYDTPPADITNIALADAQAFGAAVNCPTTYWVVVYAKDGDNLKWTSNGKTGEQTSTPRSASGRVLSAWCELYNNDVFSLPGDPMSGLTFYFSKGLATVGVTGVSLDKTTAQTIDVDGKVSFTATVAPDDATDKTVKWSVGGTDTGAVKLYSDEACTTEVGTDATETLTVYAKGESAGSATVTATSNADSEKKASCDVTVNAAQTQTEVLLTTITATGKEQASYNPENVATVSFSYTSQGYSRHDANWGWWGYGWSATVNAAEGYTITKCVFYDDKDRTATDSEAPFVVETTEEDKTPKVNGTPILANTSKGITKIEVYGYAAPETPSGYTITIPSTLAVANSGWNATDGISATGTLASGKKLTVTASSANSWALKSGDNSVGYTLTTAEGGSQTTSWEFTTLDGTAKPMGIIVENYDNKPAGTYTDTVTFTAAVENAGIPVRSVTINNAPTEALFVNSTGTLTATVLPDDATDKTVTWSSDNPNHVKIDAATGEYTVTGVDGYGSATITATATNGTVDTSDDVTATCTITGKVTYTSLSVGTVLHTGDTFYTGGSVYFNTKPLMSFIADNGVITVVEATSGSRKYYKFQRGNNGSMPNVTDYKVKDNTDGVYITGGSGTNSDKFTLAVHTTN